MKRIVIALAACFAAAMAPIQATASDVKLLAGASMRVLLPELLPQFEKASGHKLTVEYGTLGAITDRISKGEVADLVIVTGAQNDQLQKEGKPVVGSRAELAKAGYGVLAKMGAAKRDLGTVEAFKRTMLGAKWVALGDPAGGGPLGVYSADLLQRLGIADDLKTKTKLLPSGTQVAEAIAKGESEIGIGLASDAVVVPGLVAIALPAEIQAYATYTLGIIASSKQVDAARALIAFLTSPAAKQALAAKGFEPNSIVAKRRGLEHLQLNDEVERDVASLRAYLAKSGAVALAFSATALAARRPSVIVLALLVTIPVVDTAFADFPERPITLSGYSRAAESELRRSIRPTTHAKTGILVSLD